MLVKPTVAQLLERGENRYRLVIATAKRARQIWAGSESMVDTDDTSPVSIAADEIEENSIKIYDEEQWKEIQKNIIKSETVNKEE